MSPACGQVLLMGSPGPELNDGLRELVKRLQPGGFIFFHRNLAGPEQTLGLVRELAGLCREPAVFCLDQEGGRVARLRRFGVFPPGGAQLAAAGEAVLFRRHGELTGRLMRLMGFNLNLAPVVDVAAPEGRDNSLAGRCFGADTGRVVERARAFLEGMEAEGVAGTLKHFPGYTHCAQDPHGWLPRVDRTAEQMRGEELRPYRELMRPGRAVMVGHGHFPAWDAEPHPASLSPAVVGGLLRQELGFRGPVMTDDLEMGAIANRFGAARSARLALEAGNDFLLICHNPACAELAWEEVGRMPEEEVGPALERIAAFKRGLQRPPERWEEGAFAAVRSATEELAATVAAAGGA
jgi:beta-N-acetylhexosaminidase